MGVVVGVGAAVGVGEAGLGDGAAVELELGDDESEVPLGPSPVPQAARAAPRRKPIAVAALTADLILRTVRRDESGESCTGSASVCPAPGPTPARSLALAIASERTEHTGLGQCRGMSLELIEPLDALVAAFTEWGQPRPYAGLPAAPQHERRGRHRSPPRSRRCPSRGHPAPIRKRVGARHAPGGTSCLPAAFSW